MPTKPVKFKLSLALGLCLLAGAGLSAAELKLSGVFTDGMVLQRELPVPVWGTAAPDAEVAVDFAGQRQVAKAGADGKWAVQLPALPAAAAGQEFKVSSGGQTLAFKDVLVGEVWLCSGQSNMQFGLAGAEGGPAAVGEQEFSTIRFVNIPNDLSPVKLDEFKTPPGKWKPVSKATMGGVSAVAFYFARTLQAKLNVPVGLVICAWSGSQIVTWIPPESVPAIWKANAALDEAKYVKIWNDNEPKKAQQLILDEMAQSKAGYIRNWAEKKLYWRILHCFPGWTFNAKIEPLKPYAVRGVLWYQGEDNHAIGMQYSDYLRSLAGAWSKEWGRELPFFIVMLAPFKYEREGQVPAFWMAQIDAAKKLKDSEVANTIDVGNPSDIHPKNKAPVGERLALAALKKCFGQQNSAPGPVLKSAEVKGGAMEVSFDNAAGGLKFAGEAKGFELAGADRKFIPATAAVSGNASVKVECPEIAQPVYVRYGWSNTPTATLCNDEGLPALPFSTEWNADAAKTAGK